MKLGVFVTGKVNCDATLQRSSRCIRPNMLSETSRKVGSYNKAESRVNNLVFCGW